MKKNSVLKLIIIIIVVIIIITSILLVYFTKFEGADIDNNIDNNIDIDNNYEKEIILLQETKEKYECNEFTYRTITIENLLNMYLNDYKDNMINDVEKAFNSLDSEYRIKKFGDIEKYKSYINNIEEITQISLNKYIVNNYEEYDQYICIDQYNKYYIFNVTAVMEYSLMLDTYTINLPEFEKKFNSATNIEKVGYNIQKCIDSINDKDYSYMYKKLDQTFKNNNYRTEEIFENYIKNNLFERNIVDKDVSTSEENGIYVYNINIRNEDNINEVKAVTIIMKLGEEKTDFTMSFNIK